MKNDDHHRMIPVIDVTVSVGSERMQRCMAVSPLALTTTRDPEGMALATANEALRSMVIPTATALLRLMRPDLFERDAIL